MTDIVCVWDGESLVPVRGENARLANAEFVIGQRYAVTCEAPRNMKMHRAYFARVREAWQSMPAELLPDYPSAEALRHRALIKTGYATMTDFTCASSAHASQAAAAFTSLDKYALVQIEDRAVRIWRAESQSTRAMDSARFKRSIDAVENCIALIIDVTPEEMAGVA